MNAWIKRLCASKRSVTKQLASNMIANFLKFKAKESILQSSRQGKQVTYTVGNAYCLWTTAQILKKTLGADSVMWQPGWVGVQGRMYSCMCMGCAAETSAPLLISYTPVKNKMLKKMEHRLQRFKRKSRVIQESYMQTICNLSSKYKDNNKKDFFSDTRECRRHEPMMPYNIWSPPDIVKLWQRT